jgi:hypothetical protein
MQTKLQFFFFDLCLDYTVNFKGGKQVALKTTGYKKLGDTVMMCITANVSKLPPHIINRMTVPNERCNNLGLKKFMGDIGVDGRLSWMCMECQPGMLSKAQSMLVVDAFYGNLSDRIRNRLRNKNINLVIIPNGIASLL